MAITDKINVGDGTRKPAYVPVSGTVGWQVMVGVENVSSADAATITNPDTQITNNGAGKHQIIKRNGEGTSLQLCLKYSAGLGGAITSPVVKVFGRTIAQSGAAGHWQTLKNGAGAITATLTVDTTNDVTDGSYKHTTPDPSTHTWDCQGCDEMLVGVETALAGTGTVTDAEIKGKVI